MPQEGTGAEALVEIANERTRAMYELYLDGATLEEIGAFYGLTKERVRQLFREAGVSTRSTSATIAMQRDRAREQKREQICAAFSESMSIDDVARRLRITRSVVKDVVESNFRKSERRKTVVKRYADEELIAFLKAAGAGGQDVLTIRIYTEYAKGRRTHDGWPWPTHQTYAKRFGSWRAAVKAAGLATSPPPPMGHYRQFEEAHCADAIRSAAQKLGKVPTAAEYQRFATASNGAFPSQATVRNRCGTWYKALAKAGM